VGTYGKPGPRLGVTLRAPGYDASVPVKAGWEDNLLFQLDVPRPAHDQLVTMCIRNGGRTKIALYAAGDRAKSRVNVFLNGKHVEETPVLTFNERGGRTIAGSLSVTAGRIATFRGIFGHAWIIWLLGVLFVLAMPVLMGVALWRSFE
jgi:hypothetical protein